MFFGDLEPPTKLQGGTARAIQSASHEVHGGRVLGARGLGRKIVLGAVLGSNFEVRGPWIGVRIRPRKAQGGDVPLIIPPSHFLGGTRNLLNYNNNVRMYPWIPSFPQIRLDYLNWLAQ